MENNLKYTIVPAQMGCTEDERNNSLIDWWKMMNGMNPQAIIRAFQYFEGETLEVKQSPFPKSITITIKKQ